MRAPRLLACSYSSRTTAPAPSLSTKPSRSRSYGRDARCGASLNPVDSARQAAKPASEMRLTGDSVPPATIADRMRTGRACRDDGVIGSLERMRDRHITGSEIDDAAGNEKRRHPARTAVTQQNRGLGNAFDAADAGADQHAALDLILVAARMPIGIVERLGGGAHGKNDEVVDLALLLRLHPLIGVERAVAAVAARNLAGDLARDVGDL